MTDIDSVWTPILRSCIFFSVLINYGFAAGVLFVYLFFFFLFLSILFHSWARRRPTGLLLTSIYANIDTQTHSNSCERQAAYVIIIFDDVFFSFLLLLC